MFKKEVECLVLQQVLQIKKITQNGKTHLSYSPNKTQIGLIFEVTLETYIGN